MQLASFSAPISHGVLVIEDLDSPEEIPMWSSQTTVATGTSRAVALRVQHGQEGDTEVRVWGLDHTKAGIVVYDGELEVTTGHVVIHDPGDSLRVVLDVDPGLYRCTVQVDDDQHVGSVDVCIVRTD